FLEEWIYDHAVLSRFATHVETGKPIPAELVERLRVGRDFGRGVMIREGLLRRSRLSLALHDGTQPGADPRTLAEEIDARYSLFDQVDGTSWPAAWEHMNGDHYSAAYYTYLWSMAIAKDLRTAFGDDLMDLAAARRYREPSRSLGGAAWSALCFSDCWRSSGPMPSRTGVLSRRPQASALSRLRSFL